MTITSSGRPRPAFGKRALKNRINSLARAYGRKRAWYGLKLHSRNPRIVHLPFSGISYKNGPTVLTISINKKRLFRPETLLSFLKKW